MWWDTGFDLSHVILILEADDLADFVNSRDHRCFVDGNVKGERGSNGPEAVG